MSGIPDSVEQFICVDGVRGVVRVRGGGVFVGGKSTDSMRRVRRIHQLGGIVPRSKVILIIHARLEWKEIKLFEISKHKAQFHKTSSTLPEANVGRSLSSRVDLLSTPGCCTRCSLRDENLPNWIHRAEQCSQISA